MVNVAILGFGVVGSGVAEVLDTNGRHIEGKVDDLIRLKYILDVRDFPDSPFAGKVVHDFSVIEQDPEVSIVVETIGGAKVALDFPPGPPGGQECHYLQQGAGGGARLRAAAAGPGEGCQLSV